MAKRQPIQVAIFPVRSIEGPREYLLLRRVPADGGYWQCLTGGVEGKETHFEAAKRELKEETGFETDLLRQIDFTDRYPVPRNMRKHFRQGVNTLTEYVFYALISDGKNPELDGAEHDDWKWVSLEKALELLYWPGNKESLKLCDEEIQRAVSA